MDYHKQIKFIDLFCGLGAIRLGLEKALNEFNIKHKCILSCEIKKSAKEVYSLNFNENNFQDVTKINTKLLEDFDILLAGFPCQAFSSAGKRLGFEDTRGTLFFDVARIIKDKQPSLFLLENVEGLVEHNKGHTFNTIISILKDLKYNIKYGILNSNDYGLAQNRKRIYIIGSKEKLNQNIFNSIYTEKKTFKDIREYNIKIEENIFNKLIKKSNIDINLLKGKSLRDKRGGVNNIHSWDLGLKGKVNKEQKKIMDFLVYESRNKEVAKINNCQWFEGMPITFNRINEKIKIKNLKINLDDLIEKKYLKLDYPMDILNNIKIKRTELEMGYKISSGKLSFDFSNFIDDDKPTPTLVATDLIKLGVLEEKGIRKLTINEIKSLFGFEKNYLINNISDNKKYDLFGNSVTINVIYNIFYNILINK